MKKYTLDAKVVLFAEDLEDAFRKLSTGFADMNEMADSDIFCSGTEISVKAEVLAEAEKWIKKIEKLVEERDEEMFKKGVESKK